MLLVLYKTMAKIKDIYDRLKKDQKEYTELRFLIARRVFMVIVSMYFISLLFTIWGFYIGDIINLSLLSTISFHLYSILVIAVVWFGFSIAEYFVAVYLPGKDIITYLSGFVFLIFGALALYVHLIPLF